MCMVSENLLTSDMQQNVQFFRSFIGSEKRSSLKKKEKPKLINCGGPGRQSLSVCRMVESGCAELQRAELSLACSSRRESQRKREFLWLGMDQHKRRGLLCLQHYHWETTSPRRNGTQICCFPLCLLLISLLFHHCVEQKGRKKREDQGTQLSLNIRVRPETNTVINLIFQ